MERLLRRDYKGKRINCGYVTFGDPSIFLIIVQNKLSPLMSQFVSVTACDGVLWCRIHNRPSKRCGKIIFSLDNKSDSYHQNLLIIHCRVS